MLSKLFCCSDAIDDVKPVNINTNELLSAKYKNEIKFIDGIIHASIIQIGRYEAEKENINSNILINIGIIEKFEAKRKEIEALLELNNIKLK